MLGIAPASRYVAVLRLPRVCPSDVVLTHAVRSARLIGDADTGAAALVGLHHFYEAHLMGNSSKPNGNTTGRANADTGDLALKHRYRF
jgi:hypothetical protein